MSAVSDALERYFNTIESFGVTAHQRLLPPATESDLARLEEFIGADLPQEVRDWFEVSNGTDLSHPDTTSTSALLFPLLGPASVDALFELIPWYTDYTDQIDPAYTYAMRDGLPILHRFGGDEAMLLADWSGQTSRVVSWSGGEGYLDDAGYYHDSLVDYIDGVRRHAEAGRFEAVSGGLIVKDEAYTMEVIMVYSNPRGVLRMHYGFDLNDQPVPRLINS